MAQELLLAPRKAEGIPQARSSDLGRVIPRVNSHPALRKRLSGHGTQRIGEAIHDD